MYFSPTVGSPGMGPHASRGGLAAPSIGIRTSIVHVNKSTKANSQPRLRVGGLRIFITKLRGRWGRR